MYHKQSAWALSGKKINCKIFKIRKTKNNEKIYSIFLNTLIFFAFCEHNTQKSSVQDSLKKHLLGNSISGAIAICATTAVIAPLSLYFGSKITNKIISNNPLSKLSYKNYFDFALFTNLLIPFYTFKKYNSVYLIPNWIGFFIACKFTCKKLAGI